MARIITKEGALKIVAKLGAKKAEGKGKAHDIYMVHEDGKLVATFGVRHGSEKDQGHDHIPRLLHVGPHDAKDLVNCPLSRSQWIEKLKAKGLI